MISSVVFFLSFLGCVSGNEIKFASDELNLNVDETALLKYELSNYEAGEVGWKLFGWFLLYSVPGNITYIITSLDDKIAIVESPISILGSNETISGTVIITAKFIGRYLFSYRIF